MPSIERTANIRAIAEDNATTRNGTNVSADGTKIRFDAATRYGKASCRIASRPIDGYAIDNVVTAKDTADNATEKRRRNAVGIRSKIINSRFRIHIANIKIAHHAAIAIGDKAAKLAIIVFDLDRCPRSANIER